MLKQHAAAGFTLVEMLIALGIVALLLAIGTPTFRGTMENYRIRTATETWSNGLALARAEAIRINKQVSFTITANGWSVQRVDTGAVSHSGTGSEGNSGLVITTTPAGTTTVTFDSFGRVVNPNPADGSAAITQMDFAAANPSGLASYTPLRIQMLASGLARSCNPASPATKASACI